MWIIVPQSDDRNILSTIKLKNKKMSFFFLSTKIHLPIVATANSPAKRFNGMKCDTFIVHRRNQHFANSEWIVFHVPERIFHFAFPVPKLIHNAHALSFVLAIISTLQLDSLKLSSFAYNMPSYHRIPFISRFYPELIQRILNYTYTRSILSDAQQHHRSAIRFCWASSMTTHVITHLLQTNNQSLDLLHYVQT